MKAARGHGPAARLPARHHRFLRNAAKPKRKSHPRSSANMRIANALRQSAGISRNAKRSHGSRNINNNSSNNPLASSPPVRTLEFFKFSFPEFDYDADFGDICSAFWKLPFALFAERVSGDSVSIVCFGVRVLAQFGQFRA